MPRGPAPQKNKRRTNTEAIPTTQLPAKGRKGRPPKAPDAYKLGKEGAAWWRWAWGTPQAAAWDLGALYVLARRAQLEDDLAVLANLNDQLELRDLLAGADEEAIDHVAYALSTLKQAATGKLSVEKEMRELDKVLGLSPKAMVDLRWEIVAEVAEVPESKPDPAPAAASPSASRRARLSVVGG